MGYDDYEHHSGTHQSKYRKSRSNRSSWREREQHNEYERDLDNNERKALRVRNRDNAEEECKGLPVSNRDNAERGEKSGKQDNDRAGEKQKDGERRGKERSSEKEKAMKLSRIFEEQDNMNDGDTEDEDAAEKHTTKDLGGVKINHHGLDKVLAGGAVVLTLKDQSILADGDVNEEVDVLENGEIGEQKRRDEAYKAEKRKTCVYDDMFSDEPGVEKRMLDPIADEVVTLDSSGRFTGEAERKLEELRKKTQGVSAFSRGEDLNSSVRISTDYLTREEMMKFKRPTKKKSLRKKEKLDMDVLEAEAISTGLGDGDLGSRNHGRRKNLKEEEDRIDAGRRSNAYQSACAKAEEASRALKLESIRTPQADEDDMLVFGDDDDELNKSLESVRKIALKKQNEEEKWAITPLAISTADSYGAGEQQEGVVLITETDEFFSSLQNDEETQEPGSGDFGMDEDVAPIVLDQEMKDEDCADTPKKEVVLDETIRETAAGRGVAATLQLLRFRGSLTATVEQGGRNRDKKKSKLVGLSDSNWNKEIHIERTDEYGRVLTKMEAYKRISHVFHGKKPGKRKQEKRIRQCQEEQKVNLMNNADTPSLSAQRMREAQARLQTPYLVLSRKR